MLIFGGRDGEDLKHIKRLTVLIQEDHGIMGLEVRCESHVDGEASMFLGSNKPCIPSNRRPAPETLLEYEMSFDVSGGEELIALDVLQGHYVLCLKVRH